MRAQVNCLELTGSGRVCSKRIKKFVMLGEVERWDVSARMVCSGTS